MAASSNNAVHPGGLDPAARRKALQEPVEMHERMKTLEVMYEKTLVELHENEADISNIESDAAVFNGAKTLVEFHELMGSGTGSGSGARWFEIASGNEGVDDDEGDFDNESDSDNEGVDDCAETKSSSVEESGLDESSGLDGISKVTDDSGAWHDALLEHWREQLGQFGVPSNQIADLAEHTVQAKMKAAIEERIDMLEGMHQQTCVEVHENKADIGKIEHMKMKETNAMNTMMKAEAESKATCRTVLMAEAESKSTCNTVITAKAESKFTCDTVMAGVESKSTCDTVMTKEEMEMHEEIYGILTSRPTQ
ncbi:hypothetical protein N9L19_01450 [bacterium]|nr:hypothetical protein [bacterium]